MLIDGKPPLRIERQSVGSRLPILGDVGTLVAALLFEYRELAVRPVFVDGVAVRIAKEQVAAVAHPDGTLGELETFSKLVDLGVARHNVVDSRVQSGHFDIHLARGAAERYNTTFVEIELREAHPNMGCWRSREWAVDAENRQLNLLAGLHIASDHQPIRSIPAADDRSSTLTEPAREFAIHPDLCVIVQ